ncbi:Alpha/Beta hydrolase protein [Hysterangium stoloniferum]|nr:Alpha/Beta hydrolase protein [Hysterangium stoloniferum]
MELRPHFTTQGQIARTNPKAAMRDVNSTILGEEGLGQSAESWLPWVHSVALALKETTSKTIQVKWILPQAEIGPITCEQNISNPRWFDVHSLPTQSPSEIDFLRLSQNFNSTFINDGLVGASIGSLSSIIQSEISTGIPASKILLVGFSQGGSMAILTGLLSSNIGSTIGGVGVIGGWMLAELLSDQRREITHALPPPPLFWGHGDSDKIIPLNHAVGVVKWLQGRGYAYEDGARETPSSGTNSTSAHKTHWNVYPGLGHQVDDRILKDLTIWIAGVLEKTV